MIKVVAKNEFREEDMEKVMPIIEELIACTKQEKGYVSYEFCKSVDNPNLYSFIETWETIEDLVAHSKSEHYTRLGPQMKEFKQADYPIDIFSVMK